jgi:hypothetical protein
MKEKYPRNNKRIMLIFKIVKKQGYKTYASLNEIKNFKNQVIISVYKIKKLHMIYHILNYKITLVDIQ